MPPVISFHRGSSGAFSQIFARLLAWRLRELPIHLMVFIVGPVLRRGGTTSLALRRTSVRDSVFRSPMVLSWGNPLRSTNLSAVAELNCCCSANSQSMPDIRYNPDFVGPLPSIILLMSTRLVNVFIFKVASMSALYCPHALGSGWFQSSTLVGSAFSAGVAVADIFPAGAGAIVVKLLTFMEA